MKKLIQFIAYKPLALALFLPFNFLGWLAGKEVGTFKEYWELINNGLEYDDEE